MPFASNYTNFFLKNFCDKFDLQGQGQGQGQGLQFQTH